MADLALIEFDAETIRSEGSRLTNQMWKLIPMRENQENWEEQLEMILEEVRGLQVIFYKEPRFLTLRCKLEGLMSEEHFNIYRKVVFESITLIRGITNAAK